MFFLKLEFGELESAPGENSRRRWPVSASTHLALSGTLHLCFRGVGEFGSSPICIESHRAMALRQSSFANLAGRVGHKQRSLDPSQIVISSEIASQRENETRAGDL